MVDVKKTPDLLPFMGHFRPVERGGGGRQYITNGVDVKVSLYHKISKIDCAKIQDANGQSGHIRPLKVQKRVKRDILNVVCLLTNFFIQNVEYSTSFLSLVQKA
jgi:hypothetical protein